MKFFILSVVVLVFVASAAGLQCYFCISTVQSTCSDEYKSEESHLNTCTEDNSQLLRDFTKTLQQQPVSVNKNVTVKANPSDYQFGCVKAKGKVNDVAVVQRQCIRHIKGIEIKDDCQNVKQDVGGTKVEAEVCVCYKDKCNGSVSLSASLLLSFMAILSYMLA